MNFIPTIQIELEYPNGQKSTRALRFDLRAARLVGENFNHIEGGWPNAPTYEALPYMLWALTSHDRREGEKPEDFEACLGPANLEYFGAKLTEAMGRASAKDEDEDPTPALVNGQGRPTGTKSKPSPKPASVSPQVASTQ